MNIEKLCQRSHKTALEKGWYEEDRSLGEVLALMHSEISEALECYRDSARQPDEVWQGEGGKPEGMVIELADLLIRIGDTCEHLKIPVATKLCNTQIGTLGYGMEEKEVPIIVQLTRIHVELSKCFMDFDPDVTEFLAMAMSRTGALCRQQGWDLEKAVLRKMAYNETRPHRHGGKRI